MQEAHILAMLILGVCSFAVGSIPLKLTRSGFQPFSLSLTLCFGGGVLISTAVIHMLTESIEKLPTFASMLFCGGFLFLYAIDEMIHVCVGDIHHLKEESHNTSRHSSIDNNTNQVRGYSPLQTAVTNYGTLQKLPKRTRIDSLTNSFHAEGSTDAPIPYDYTKLDEDSHCCRKHEKEKSFRRGAWKSHVGDGFPTDVEIESETSSLQSEERGELCHVEVKQKPCVKSNMSLPGLLTALLIHSLLEGCSIGVQTQSSQILLVLAAVACHKLVLAFCLGLELSNAGYDGLRFVIAMTAFSIGCPIGIGIGVSLTSSSTSFFDFEAPSQAVAAGSLMYVAVFEVLPRERYKWQHRPNFKAAGFYQAIFVIIGFSLMTTADIFASGFHEHEHPTSTSKSL